LDSGVVVGAIGVFDSGVGGLSILQAIRRQLPWWDLLYVADSKHVPWGDKSVEFIRKQSISIGRFLLRHGAAVLVIGSNTGTAASAEFLRAMTKVPVVAVEPAIKPAAAATRTGVVGVLVTSATSQSSRFATLVERFGKGVRVMTQPAPGLVERVERGDLGGQMTRALLQRYLSPFQRAGVDTIVLGCTHYVFLRPVVMEIMGPGVLILDSGHAVARQVVRVLGEEGCPKG
jgi:glutamate racemase